MLIFMIVGSIIGFRFVKIFAKPNLKLKLVNALLGLSLGLLVGSLFGLFLNLFVKGEYKTVDSVQLAVLNDNTGINGSFTLGCGTIDNTMFYAYYEKDKNSEEYTLKTIECKKATIKNITDGSLPRLETQGYIPTTTFGKFFTIPCKFKTIFFVPEGSIKTGFNLDAQ